MSGPSCEECGMHFTECTCRGAERAFTAFIDDDMFEIIEIAVAEAEKILKRIPNRKFSIRVVEK
jgi:hypothetical protein